MSASPARASALFPHYQRSVFIPQPREARMPQVRPQSPKVTLEEPMMSTVAMSDTLAKLCTDEEFKARANYLAH